MNIVLGKCRGSAWVKSIVAVIGSLVLLFADTLPSYAQQYPIPSSQPKDKAASIPDASHAIAAGANATSHNTSVQKAEAAPATESTGRGPHEGIKVHGHWTIEVRNPDGNLVTHREFENSLQPLGAQVIGQLLTRQVVVGGMAIQLDAQSSSASPCLTASSTTACLIFDSMHPVQACISSTGISELTPANCFGTLMPPFSGTGSNANAIYLQGQATAAQAGTIEDVSTLISACDTKILTGCSPIAVGFIGDQLLTAASLGPLSNCGTASTSPCQVTVLAGQIIAVTVVISFS